MKTKDGEGRRGKMKWREKEKEVVKGSVGREGGVGRDSKKKREKESEEEKKAVMMEEGGWGKEGGMREGGAKGKKWERKLTYLRIEPP